VELSDAIDFARTNRSSVLTTIRGNGLPQLSNVVHYVGDDHIIRISITAGRAKYHNLLRRPWAALQLLPVRLRRGPAFVAAKDDGVSQTD